MLAQVTYIPKFIMADSEEEFMPLFVTASAAFVENNPTHLPAGRRADVGAGRQYQTYLIPPADVVHGHRRDARRPADATIFGTHMNNARPMPHDVPGRPAGLVSSRLKMHTSDFEGHSKVFELWYGLIRHTLSVLYFTTVMVHCTLFPPEMHAYQTTSLGGTMSVIDVCHMLFQTYAFQKDGKAKVY